MAVITKLRAGKRDPSRVNVYLDGKFTFSLSADEVLSRHFKIGLELDSDQVTALSSLSTEEKLYAKILNFLSYRPRSRREVELRLQKYLLDHDDPQPVVNDILTKLEKGGYLDDEAFTRWFITSRQNNRPRSSRHLTAELASKGISRQVITTTLTELSDDEAAIHQLIAKKHGMPRDKLIAYLARRGFSYTLIKQSLGDL